LEGITAAATACAIARVGHYCRRFQNGRAIEIRRKIACDVAAHRAGNVGSRGAETLAEIRKITGGSTDFALEASAVPA
jgi:hypothetical protein